MKQIASTLNVILRQEWISVVTYFVATVFFLFMIFQIGTNVAEDAKREYSIVALLMITMLSFFIGIYLGTGVLRLQQSLLWQLHVGYRVTLMASFIVGAFLYGLIQLYPMLYAGWSWPIAALAPPCITLLTAQLVIGNNFIMKFMFPAWPFILFQLTHFQVTDETILMLLILLTLIALSINSQSRKIASSAAINLVSGNTPKKMKSGFNQKLNTQVADIFRKVIFAPSSKDFNTAIIPPASRYGLLPVVAILICIIVMHYLVGENGKLNNVTIAIMMMGSMILGSFIELKLNARQTKPLVHLYSKDNHRMFKSNILNTIDKHVVCQTMLLIAFMLITNTIIEGFASPLLMIKMGITATLVAAAFLPLMLCLNWFNMSLKLIATLILYFGLGVITLRWQYNHTLSDLLSLEVMLSVIVLIGIRLSAMYFWRRQAVEQFMRIYG